MIIDEDIKLYHKFLDDVELPEEDSSADQAQECGEVQDTDDEYSVGQYPSDGDTLEYQTDVSEELRELERLHVQNCEQFDDEKRKTLLREAQKDNTRNWLRRVNRAAIKLRFVSSATIIMALTISGQESILCVRFAMSAPTLK